MLCDVYYTIVISIVCRHIKCHQFCISQIFLFRHVHHPKRNIWANHSDSWYVLYYEYSDHCHLIFLRLAYPQGCHILEKILEILEFNADP